jgi:hypothetical protein
VDETEAAGHVGGGEERKAPPVRPGATGQAAAQHVDQRAPVDHQVAAGPFGRRPPPGVGHSEVTGQEGLRRLFPPACDLLQAPGGVEIEDNDLDGSRPPGRLVAGEDQLQVELCGQARQPAQHQSVGGAHHQPQPSVTGHQAILPSGNFPTFCDTECRHTEKGRTLTMRTQTQGPHLRRTP